jgi:hypothetical protein
VSQPIDAGRPAAAAGRGRGLNPKAVEIALSGDPTALRLCLDRLIAPHRERLVRFALPPMRRPADLAAAMEAIASAVARGVRAPAEAPELAKVVDTFDTAIETRGFDSQLRELEEGR